ncbi:MAG TPA: hypothetical protein VMU59_06705 [Caulobacteraceae bacterium]|nr:hypothetical protein [Caulobacteraceae bacterium]
MPAQRKDIPAHWQWRDGRPRWIPAPALRAAGWKGHDLKDAAGAFLGRGASIDRASTINEAVKAWRAGELIPPEFEAIAPAGAVFKGGAGAAPAHGKLAIGRLIEAYAGDPARHIAPSDKFAGLAPATQRDYRGKLKRLVDALAGYVVLPPAGADLSAYEAAVEAIRAASVLALEPVETARGIEDPLYTVYHRIKAEVGPHQASGVLAAASAWLGWCRERQSRQIRNWAAEVERETPPGRIRVGTLAEVQALIASAEALGWPSIADSIILGLDLSWSQVDRLALTWGRVKDGRCLTGAEGRAKTGRVGGTPLTALGRARLAQIQARQADMAAQPTHVLWCERRDKHGAPGQPGPWKPDHYRHIFADVRAHAAKTCPSVADFTDADLRDTAITWARSAGLNTDQLASRTLQSRRRINDLHDKHYGEIGPEIADQGGVLLDSYFTAKKVKL